MAPQITDSQQTQCINQLPIPPPRLTKDEGFGAKVLRHDGERTLRILANFSEQDTDLVVKPVDDKLYILDDKDSVLRVYDLPEIIDPFTVTAELREDGLLTITSQLQNVMSDCTTL